MGKISAVLLILAMFFMSTPAFGDERPLLLVSGSYEWPPYLMFNRVDNHPRGALHDLLDEACEVAGAYCVFVDYPWKRVLDYLEYGDIDIVCGLYSTVERRGKFIYSEPIFTDEMRVFSTQPLVINDISDLKGLRGDAQLGASYGDDIDAYMARHLDIVRQKHKKNSMQRLLSKDTDYIMCPYLNCMEVVREMGLENRIQALPHVLGTNKVHIAFSRHSQNPALIMSVKRELDRLIQSGRADEILQSYLNR